ncbi:MAG: M48 family metalloprotease, partial [Planctomycetota bacterium]
MSPIARPITLLACLSSCALPPTSFDVEQGEQVALSIESEIGTYADDRIRTWFEPMAARLVEQVGETPFEYRFAILDQPEPNAFAAPGGYVYVSRGLLALAQSEDEVAGVVA